MNNTVPLSEQLRPKELGEVCGQSHLLSEKSMFRRSVEGEKVSNMIFFGPSGVGKTTVARIIAKNTNMKLHSLNGTSAATKDIKTVISEINQFDTQNGILLYLDEIQYLNKKQQQSLLEVLEDGSITLIASTTENPHFYIYPALLSRCSVFEFKSITQSDVEKGIANAVQKAEKILNKKIVLEQTALKQLSFAARGDMRKAINALDFILSASGSKKTVKITVEDIQAVTTRSSASYDKDGDIHYDLLSGLQKSIRGSDPNAAMHYLARLLVAGDIISPSRRLLVMAAEDVGLAYPQAAVIVKSLVDTAFQLGLPEARIPLAEAALLLATAPKSNSSYLAINAAMADVQRGNYSDVPEHLKSKPVTKPKHHYIYPHEHKNHWVQQQYLPDAIKDASYYNFGDNKTESLAKEYWEKIKTK